MTFITYDSGTNAAYFYVENTRKEDKLETKRIWRAKGCSIYADFDGDRFFEIILSQKEEADK